MGIEVSAAGETALLSFSDMLLSPSGPFRHPAARIHLSPPQLCGQEEQALRETLALSLIHI